MPDSLCFRIAGARTKAGPHLKAISEEEWMWHLVMHMCNARHPLDSTPDPMTMLIDPVGNSVKVMALNNDYEPLRESEAQLYEKLLVDALHGDVDAVKAAFDSVRQLRSPHFDPLQTVAAIGAIKGHMSIVQFALDRGVRHDRNFCLAVRQGSDATAEMAAFYEENREAFDKMIEIERGPNKVWTPPYPGFSITALDEEISR